jgi:hypothetical protein
MKIKSQPTETNFGNHIEQSLYKGLSKDGKKYAREQVKHFTSNCMAIPYGLIRLIALKK